MSAENIYGGWSTGSGDLHDLWMKLSAQFNLDGTLREANFGISQRKHEITELWKLYMDAAPKVVLEIGVSQGGTFAAWCQLGRDDATLIGIDRDLNDCRPRPREPVHPSIYSGPLAHTINGGGLYSLERHQQTVHGINGWSHEPHVMEQLLETLGGRKVDFCFHDASHSAELFARDFQLYWPLIAEGGVFAAHDIAPSANPDCNKSEEWQRILREETYSAVYQYLPHPIQTEMGIGAIIR